MVLVELKMVNLLLRLVETYGTLWKYEDYNTSVDELCILIINMSRRNDDVQRA